MQIQKHTDTYADANTGTDTHADTQRLQHRPTCRYTSPHSGTGTDMHAYIQTQAHAQTHGNETITEVQ